MFRLGINANNFLPLGICGSFQLLSRSEVNYFLTPVFIYHSLLLRLGLTKQRNMFYKQFTPEKGKKPNISSTGFLKNGTIFSQLSFLSYILYEFSRILWS